MDAFILRTDQQRVPRKQTPLFSCTATMAFGFRVWGCWGRVWFDVLLRMLGNQMEVWPRTSPLKVGGFQPELLHLGRRKKGTMTARDHIRRSRSICQKVASPSGMRLAIGLVSAILALPKTNIENLHMRVLEDRFSFQGSPAESIFVSWRVDGTELSDLLW